MEDDRRRRRHDRARSPQARRVNHCHARERRERAGARRCPVRGFCRGSVPALRTQLEAADAGGQPELSEESDSAVFRRAADFGDHEGGCAELVFLPAREAGGRRPVGPGPFGHLAPGGGLRSSPRREQSLREHPTLPAPRPRALPVEGGTGPACSRAGGTRGRCPRQGSDHPASHSHRLPQGGGARSGVAGLPRGQAVSARQQDRAADGLAFGAGPQAARRVAPQGCLHLLWRASLRRVMRSRALRCGPGTFRRSVAALPHDPDSRTISGLDRRPEDRDAFASIPRAVATGPRQASDGRRAIKRRWFRQNLPDRTLAPDAKGR